MTFTNAEKNKSKHKLLNFGPVYYLNLDDQPERRQYMEDQFEYWGVENYERISALMVEMMILGILSRDDIQI